MIVWSYSSWVDRNDLNELEKSIFNTQRGGGPILDHAPFNFYEAKPSDQI